MKPPVIAGQSEDTGEVERMESFKLQRLTQCPLWLFFKIPGIKGRKHEMVRNN